MGRLRFEPGFWRMRQSILTTGDMLLGHMDRMSPMFEPRTFDGKTKVGKYSYSEEERAEIFGFAIEAIRKYSDCTIFPLLEQEPVAHESDAPGGYGGALVVLPTGAGKTLTAMRWIFDVIPTPQPRSSHDRREIQQRCVRLRAH